MSDMLGKRKHESASCELRYSKALPIELRQLVREVFNVKTDAGMRGKGHGSRLMESLVKEADKSKKVLILLPDNEKLELWYNRFGFERVQSEPVVLMMRKPAEMATRGNNGLRTR